jgi:hypothetical protein
MTKRAIFFGFWLFLGLSLCGNGYAQPSRLDQPMAVHGEFIKVEEAPLSLHEILHLEPGHLFALGAGIVVGATVIGPYFEVGELTGIVVGLIAGTLAYQVWSSQHHSW